MVPEAVEAVEVEWVSKSSLRRLVYFFFFGFKPSLLGNSDVKLTLL